jgi:hypothetical protein
MPAATKPSTNIQRAAIQNGAQGNNLVSQLLAGKPSVTSSPSVLAASSGVKNSNAPFSYNSVTPSPNTAPFSAQTPQTSPTGQLTSLYSPAQSPSNPLNQGTLNLAPPATDSTSQSASVTPATTQTNTAYTAPGAAPVTALPNNGSTYGTTPSNTAGAMLPGLIGNLGTTAASGSATGKAITNTLENTSAASSPAVTADEQATAQAGLLNPALTANAQQISNNFLPQEQNLLDEANIAIANNSTGGAGPIGLGAAGEIENNVGNQLTGESNIENSALTANAQGLTAAQQEANAEAAAGGLANTQQANIQSGEAAAGGLANTAQANTQSGLQEAGALASPNNSTQTVGQGQTVLNASGQPVATTPVVAPVGSEQKYTAPVTTYGANGQPTTASGGTPNSDNPNTPFTAGQVSGQESLGATSVANNASIIAAQGIQQKLNNDITQNGINSLSSANAANAINQWVQGNLSNPAYQNFFQDLTDYTQTIAPLIGVSGTITDMKTAIGQSLLNSTASGQTIMEGLNNLNQLALNKNAAVGAAGQGSAGQGATPAGQNTQSVSTSQNSGTTIQSSIAPGSYAFVNGQWIVQQ